MIELATEEGMVLKFPDPESLESFRAYAYSKNAYGKVVSLSVRRKQLEITVAKAEEA